MLDKYESDDQLLLSIAKTAIGDAFSEINQPKEAIEYYKKAIKLSQNALTTPITLMKCAHLYESEEKFKEAINCYTTIKEDYSDTKIAQNIDKYINRINER